MQILVIDDEDVFADELCAILREHGYACATARTGRAGLDAAEQEPPDLVLCDLSLPDVSGIEVLQQLGQTVPDAAVFMITAHGTLDAAVQALRLGAHDFFLKPLQLDVLLAKLHRFAAHRGAMTELRTLRRLLDDPPSDDGMVGATAAMAGVRRALLRAAPTTTTVLIRGETGVGKELAARAVHQHSTRRNGPWVTVNCAALPENLIEAELFGYRRGAFTGADQNRVGLIEAADRGTLFLDEVGELPLNVQAKLLRALDDRAVTRLGTNAPREIDLRLVAATNRNLVSMVRDGSFREDLYYRIHVFEIEIPPLRERREDIPSLVDHFVQTLNARMGCHAPGPTAAAVQALVAYDWPGNVRELRNVIERALLYCDNDYIDVAHLPTDLQRGTATTAERQGRLEQSLAVYEAAQIRDVLARTGNNRTAAARELGISRATLYRRLNELGIDSGDGGS